MSRAPPGGRAFDISPSRTGPKQPVVSGLGSTVALVMTVRVPIVWCSCDRPPDRSCGLADKRKQVSCDADRTSAPCASVARITLIDEPGYTQINGIEWVIDQRLPCIIPLHEFDWRILRDFGQEVLQRSIQKKFVRDSGVLEAPEILIGNLQPMMPPSDDTKGFSGD